MKPLITSIAILLLNAAVFAQEAPRNNKPSPTKPAEAAAAQVAPEDPFIRRPGAPPTEQAEGALNLILVAETWGMSQADFLSLLDESVDGQVAYEKVQELAKAKKA